MRVMKGSDPASRSSTLTRRAASFALVAARGAAHVLDQVERGGTRSAARPRLPSTRRARLSSLRATACNERVPCPDRPSERHSAAMVVDHGGTLRRRGVMAMGDTVARIPPPIAPTARRWHSDQEHGASRGRDCPITATSGVGGSVPPMDIDEFYEGDPRRRASAELELGTDWMDADNVRHELNYVEDTGELYVLREPAPHVNEDPFGGLLRERIAGLRPQDDRARHRQDPHQGRRAPDPRRLAGGDDASRRTRSGWEIACGRPGSPWGRPGPRSRTTGRTSSPEAAAGPGARDR